MKLQLFAIAAAFIFATTANADPIIAQSYPITSVQELSAGGGVDLVITQGETESLRVETTAEVMKRVKVDLTNHRLTLGVKNEGGGFTHWFGNHNDKVKFFIQVKRINLLDLSGAVSATMGLYRGQMLAIKLSGAAETYFNDLQTTDVAFELSGASNAEIKVLNSQKVNVNLSGASNFQVEKSGTVSELIVVASGASNYESEPLSVNHADVQASGASNIEVRATETLKAGATGSSNIDHYGSAKVTANANGASQIDGH
ncbi:MAG: DUF2807 domain-containing protein [Pseudomonadota bacterium]